LEKIAKCVQRDLYRRLKSGDPATDAWFEGVTRQIAAAFRAKKKWLLTPRADTRAELIESLSKSLAAVASANWDAMEKIEPTTVPIRWLWSQRIVESLRTILVAGVPLAVLWIVQLSPLALSDPIQDGAVIAGVIWALPNVITVFDPSFRERIDILKEVMDLLPFASKKS
jgi:hypothetical protein